MSAHKLCCLIVQKHDHKAPKYSYNLVMQLIIALQNQLIINLIIVLIFGANYLLHFPIRFLMYQCVAQCSPWTPSAILGKRKVLSWHEHNKSVPVGMGELCYRKLPCTHN